VLNRLPRDRRKTGATAPIQGADQRVVPVNAVSRARSMGSTIP